MGYNLRSIPGKNCFFKNSCTPAYIFRLPAGASCTLCFGHVLRSVDSGLSERRECRVAASGRRRLREKVSRGLGVRGIIL